MFTDKFIRQLTIQFTIYSRFSSLISPNKKHAKTNWYEKSFDFHVLYLSWGARVKSKKTKKICPAELRMFYYGVPEGVEISVQMGLQSLANCCD